jgi:ribosomal protein L16 Arg81 hydroxylase
VKVVRNSEIINPVFYSNEQKSVGPFIANPVLMLKEYQNGSTLKYDKLQLTYPPIARKISRLEKELNVAIRTSVYLSPKNSVGYGLHTDRHDIFALQINGCKIWNVRFAEEILPSNYDAKIEVKWDEKEIQRIEVNAGDLFYCPRGLSHEVFTENQSSIHFTIGLQPIYGYHLIESIGTEAYKNIFFKKAIPGPFSENTNYLDEFKSELHQLIDNLDIEALMEITKKLKEKYKLKVEENTFLSEFYQPGKEDEFYVSKEWNMVVTKYACIIKSKEESFNFPIGTEAFFKKLKTLQKIKISEIESDFTMEQHQKFILRLFKIKLIY